MKKIALIIAITGIVGLSSCNKDYVCTSTITGNTITLSNDDVTSCDDSDVCETSTYAEITEDTPEVTDKESAKAYIEDLGFTCK